jgi:hypothetical protein
MCHLLFDLIEIPSFNWGYYFISKISRHTPVSLLLSNLFRISGFIQGKSIYQSNVAFHNAADFFNFRRFSKIKTDLKISPSFIQHFAV